MNKLEMKKDYLRRYRVNVLLVRRLENKHRNIDEKLYKVKSPNYSGMPRGGVPFSIEDLISKKLEIEKRIARLKAKGEKIREEILEKIDELEDTRHVEIMELYFIECKDFRTMASETGYTERHIFRLYSEAINRMSDIGQEHDNKVTLH